MTALFAVMLAAMLAAMLACTDAPRSPPAAPEALAIAPPPPSPEPWSPPEGFTRLRISLTPYLDEAGLLATHEPFRIWLSERLGVPVDLRVAAGYDELGAQLRAGDVDLGEFSPYAYVRARSVDAALDPLVSYIAAGAVTAAGYIVVDAGSRYQTLDDLRGARFAFVDRASTSGYLYPQRLLVERGLDPDTAFSSVEFLGNHQAVLLAVHDGRAEAGAVFAPSLRALKAKTGISPQAFRIIGKTERIPNDLLCAAGTLAQSVRDEVRRLLLGLTVVTAEGRPVLTPMGINAFVLADDHAYDPVRDADAALRARGAAGP